MTLRLSRIIAIVALSAMGPSCHRASSTAADGSDQSEKEARAQRLAPLLDFEESERSARRAPHVRADVLGPDPYRVVAQGENYVGLLARTEAVVLFDRQLHETARVTGPRGASGLVLAKDGVVLASGELDNRVLAYRAANDDLTEVANIALGDVRGVRALAWGKSRVFALDTAEDRVVSFALADDFRAHDERRFETCRGAIDVAATDDTLRVTCLFDHALALYPLDASGTPGKEARIVHDGPIWSSDVSKIGDEFLVAIGGVEDHALDRTIGSFGNVDSFVSCTAGAPARHRSASRA